MVEHINGSRVVIIHKCFPRNMYNLKKMQIKSTSKCFERSKTVVRLVDTPMFSKYKASCFGDMVEFINKVACLSSNRPGISSASKEDTTSKVSAKPWPYMLFTWFRSQSFKSIRLLLYLLDI